MKPVTNRIVLALVVCLVAGAFLAFGAETASAFDETPDTVNYTDIGEDTCAYCHPDADPSDPDWDLGFPSGPHGNYTAATDKCECCHTVHDAKTPSIKLLPAATVKATCMTCHDGTQGRGVYGAIEKRLGPGAVKADHSIDVTSLVPGGSLATGGSATMEFSSADKYLTCSDCHSVHGTDVVAAFVGDRVRYSVAFPAMPSTKLLRNQPGVAATPVDYGSDWCLGCHQGRGNGMVAYSNHPVDSVGSYTSGDPFDYGYIARLVSDDPTALTEVSSTNLMGGPPWGGMGRSNRAYLMPWPRTFEQGTHKPICQQCHEDSRDVGELSGDGSFGDATTFAPALDGLAVGVPQFQNFPHESTNIRLLVETEDELCINCHPPMELP